METERTQPSYFARAESAISVNDHAALKSLIEEVSAYAEQFNPDFIEDRIQRDDLDELLTRLREADHRLEMVQYG